MKFNSRAGAVVSLMLVQMSVAERAVLSIRGEGDGSGRALKGIKKCKFQLSGLEGKLVDGVEALGKKKKFKAADLPNVCRAECYSDWASMKGYIQDQLDDGATSISVGLCSNVVMTVPEIEYEIDVDNGPMALTNFEMVCCGLPGSCIVDGENTPLTDPLITLGDIGEVLIQGVKFRNVNSQNVPEGLPVPAPSYFSSQGAVISGLHPSVVYLNDVSVDNVDITANDRTGLYFTQSVVLIDGGEYNNIESERGAIYLNRGRLFVRGVTFTNNKTQNGGALTLVGVAAVVRDSILTNNDKIGTCESAPDCASCDTVPICGGGAIQQIGGSLELIKNNFQNNDVGNDGRGGALALLNVLLVASENVFRGNTSVEAGGAVYSSSGQAVFFDNLFESNGIEIPYPSRISGGAIATEQTALTLVSNIFKGNSLQGFQGTIGGTIGVTNGDGFASGGALSLLGYQGLGAAVIEGNTFDSNTSSGASGAIDASQVGSLSLTCNQFISNVAANGGGGAIDVVQSHVTSKGNTFETNTSTTGGGALLLRLSQMTSVEDIFRNNEAGLLDNDIEMYPYPTDTDSSLLITCDVSPITVTGYPNGLSDSNNDFYLIDPTICSVLD